MVHFPGFARARLWIHRAVRRFYQRGFPHSEIPGSKPACGSPRLIAACHVLRRHLPPRHPPCALSSLTIKFTQHRAALPPAIGRWPLAVGKNHLRAGKSYGAVGSSLPVIADRKHQPTKALIKFTRLVVYPIYSVVKHRLRRRFHHRPAWAGMSSTGAAQNSAPRSLGTLNSGQPQTAELGGADRARTGDPLLAKQVLSQLSYSPRVSGGPG